jgi:hypothetical protein
LPQKAIAEARKTQQSPSYSFIIDPTLKAVDTRDIQVGEEQFLEYVGDAFDTAG